MKQEPLKEKTEERINDELLDQLLERAYSKPEDLSLNPFGLLPFLCLLLRLPLWGPTPMVFGGAVRTKNSVLEIFTWWGSMYLILLK